MTPPNLPKAHDGGTTCGARKRQGPGVCKQVAGWGTDHVGAGRCKLHGGATPIKHGLRSTIERPDIRQLVEHYLADPDPLNLMPELAKLRALADNYINRHSAAEKALLAWHASWGHNAEGVGLLAGIEVAGELLLDPALLAEFEAEFRKRWAERVDLNQKPRQLPDLAAAGDLFAKAAKVAETIHKMRQEGSITMAAAYRAMEQMAMGVMAAAGETIPDAAQRTAFLEACQRHWGPGPGGTIGGGGAGPGQGHRLLPAP